MAYQSSCCTAVDFPQLLRLHHGDARPSFAWESLKIVCRAEICFLSNLGRVDFILLACNLYFSFRQNILIKWSHNKRSLGNFRSCDHIFLHIVSTSTFLAALSLSFRIFYSHWNTFPRNWALWQETNAFISCALSFSLCAKAARRKFQFNFATECSCKKFNVLQGLLHPALTTFTPAAAKIVRRRPNAQLKIYVLACYCFIWRAERLLDKWKKRINNLGMCIEQIYMQISMSPSSWCFETSARVHFVRH